MVAVERVSVQEQQERPLTPMQNVWKKTKMRVARAGNQQADSAAFFGVLFETDTFAQDVLRNSGLNPVCIADHLHAQLLDVPLKLLELPQVNSSNVRMMPDLQQIHEEAEKFAKDRGSDEVEAIDYLIKGTEIGGTAFLFALSSYIPDLENPENSVDVQKIQDTAILLYRYNMGYDK